MKNDEFNFLKVKTLFIKKKVKYCWIWCKSTTFGFFNKYHDTC